MCGDKSLIIIVTPLFWSIINRSYIFLFVEGTKMMYKRRISRFLNDSKWFNICIFYDSWNLLFNVRFIVKSLRFIELYAFLFAEYTKKTYYNIKISIKFEII